jgi:hypothetical protein
MDFKALREAADLTLEQLTETKTQTDSDLSNIYSRCRSSGDHSEPTNFSGN